MTNRYHILPNGNGWAVLREGNSRPSATARTKKEAVKLARELVSRRGGSLIFHRPDGTFSSN